MDKNILVVDDDESIAKVIKVILTQHGFSNISIAHSGKQALNWLGISDSDSNTKTTSPSRSIDLVILDVFLPDVSGFDVCDDIKKRYAHSLPVIMMTGFEILEYVARGVEVGADDFLSKPIKPEELVARIKILLQRNNQSIGRPYDSYDLSGVVTQDNEKKIASEFDKIDHYQIESMLTWSASTMVYTVKDDRTGERYVLKRLLRQVLEFPEVTDRFCREIEIMKNMKHPNICQIYADGEIEGCPYCIIEYIAGDDLEIVLRRSNPVSFSTIYSVAQGVANALKHIHDTGIIHRDIKLKNIYLSDDGQVKLSDFGVAVKIGETRITQHGYTIGTPIYMAPEQFDGDMVTHLADIYSYGASLYHLITGHAPFTAENTLQLMHKHHNEPPIPIAQYRNDVPEGWNELVVNQCLAKNPEDRPPSMMEVIHYLRDLES